MSKTPDPTQTTGTANIRSRLALIGSFHNGRITLDGSPIGGFVTYGKISRRTGNAAALRVYGSRIYRSGLAIEVEASSSRVMLNKVAAELAKAMRAGKWEVSAA